MIIKLYQKCIGLAATLFLRLYIHLFGLSFNMACSASERKLLGESTFTTLNNFELKFVFYKKFYKKMVYKRGNISKTTVSAYMVECMFDEHFPARLKSFNTVKFVLTNRLLALVNEKITMHILLGFYIDFLVSELGKDIVAL